MHGQGITSQIGKRLLLLFLGVGLIPLLTFALSIIVFHERTLMNEAHREMARRSQETGADIFQVLKRGQIMLCPEFIPSPGVSVADSPNPFRRITLMHRDDATPWPPPSATARAALESGATVLSLPYPAGAVATVALLRRMPDGKIVAGEIDPDALWAVTGDVMLSALDELFIFDEKGRLLVSTHFHPLFSKPLGNIPGGSRMSGRTTVGQTDYIWSGSRLWLQDPFSGENLLIVVARPYTSVLMLRDQISSGLLMLLGLSIATLILIASRISRNFVQPLFALTRAVHHLGETSFASEIGEVARRTDEIGTLARSFATMSVELEAKRSELIESNRILLENEMTMRQAHKMEAIGTLTAGIAHEINNPLTYLLQNLDLLKERSRCGGREVHDDFVPLLDDAIDGAHRVRTIVKDLMTYAHTGDEAETHCDVNRATRRAVKLALNEMRIRARLIEQYEDPIHVRAHEGRLVQIIVNMLVNAAHAIPPGKPEQNAIHVTTRRVDENACIEIRDTGSGIDPGDLERIFDPFFTTKPVGVGTGLGLSVCQNLITALGGRIDVSSTKGVGSIFLITLPLEPPLRIDSSRSPTDPASQELTAAEPVVVVPPGVRRKRVLFIDDERAIRRCAVRMLSPDFDVTLAAHGRDALRIIESEPAFDEIICDLMMPEMSGVDLRDVLTTRFPEMAQRMIFITGGAFSDDMRAFLSRVTNRVLEKPFSAAQIRALIT